MDAKKIQEAKNRYLREEVDTVTIRIKKGKKTLIQNYAKTKGKSLNKYILDLIEKDMEK